jgi:cyclohexyl-isocyanide hydratase
VRFLYHVVPQDTVVPDRYAPASLGTEGFIHASFAPDVSETARMYFAPNMPLKVWQWDPRRIAARVEYEQTPRGPMPHIYGTVPRDALRQELTVAQAGVAPDLVRGTRVAFLAFDGMTLLDLVGIMDPITRIKTMGFDDAFEASVVGATDLCWEAFGARLVPHSVRPALDGFDLLVIPGGPGTRALKSDEALLQWLLSYPEERWVATVCTGSVLYGGTSRLRGLRATTHHSAVAELEALGAILVRERVVRDGALTSGAGVTAGIDVGLAVVERLMGADVRAQIARQMEYAGL